MEGVTGITERRSEQMETPMLEGGHCLIMAAAMGIIEQRIDGDGYIVWKLVLAS